MLQADSGAAVSSSRAGADTIGTVISVTGSQATIKLAALQPAQEARITVGKFAAIRSGPVTVIGVVTRLAERPGESVDEPAISIAELDLLGELKGEAGARFFQRGVTEYPALGDESELLGGDDLRLIYDLSGADVIVVGQLQQDAELPAYIKVNEMLAKHFAFFGTTGVGKSTGVALLLRKILEARPDLRIFLVDPHNEYGRSFGDCALVLNPKNLRLPFWLFNFEETVDVFFGGRPGIEEEVEILSEAIPRAKTLFAADRAFERMSLRKNPEELGFTQDTPVPYRLADLVALIGERMGKLENRSVAGKYARLITRIELVRKDPRYAFMFDNANVGGDVIVEVLSQLFRLPPEGKPMTVMQLAGFPAEVIDSVVSVLGRMAFDFGLWSDGAVPMLFVCEEAHRYAPADRTLGFGPTRKAISRIAKEGRKYGVHLGLITQRPAELDPTIISQMSTIFAMRMANERDQAIIRSAVSDAAASLLAFVPSLGTREVFAFGEGVSLPTRLRFAEVAEQQIPRSSSVLAGRIDPSAGINDQFIARVVDRWRGVTTSSRPKLSEPPDEGLWGSTETVLRGPADSLGLQSNLWGADTAGPAPAAPEPRKPMSEWTKHKLAQARKPLDR